MMTWFQICTGPLRSCLGCPIWVTMNYDRIGKTWDKAKMRKISAIILRYMYDVFNKWAYGLNTPAAEKPFNFKSR